MKSYPINKNNKYFGVYQIVEPMLYHGNKISFKQVYSRSQSYPGLALVGMAGYGCIRNHFYNIMNALIESGHVSKLDRGLWYVKLRPIS